MLKRGNAALRGGQPHEAINHYVQAALQLDAGSLPLATLLEDSLELARHHHVRRRRAAWLRGEPVSVAVCGWELSHNPAGRVLTLAEAYRRVVPNVEIIGAIFPRWGRTLWSPMQGVDIPCHSLLVEDEADFISQALRLVAAHPYDLVHLSKPRFPNLVFGLLYELVWGAKVVWDIDDEELGFVKATEPLPFQRALNEEGQLPPPEETARCLLDPPDGRAGLTLFGGDRVEPRATGALWGRDDSPCA